MIAGHAPYFLDQIAGGDGKERASDARAYGDDAERETFSFFEPVRDDAEQRPEDDAATQLSMCKVRVSGGNGEEDPADVPRLRRPGTKGIASTLYTARLRRSQQ